MEDHGVADGHIVTDCQRPAAGVKFAVVADV